MSNMKVARYFDGRDRSLVLDDHWRSRDRLYDWWEEHMKRIEDDFFRNRGTLTPYDFTPMSVFAPGRRRRLFETMFHNDEDYKTRIVENHIDNSIEYHLPTGALDNEFQPEDLEVNIRGRDVEIKARHETKSVDGKAHTVREFRRVVRVPDGVDVHRVATELRNNGKIILKAPLNALYEFEEKFPYYRSTTTPYYRTSGTLTPIRMKKLW